MTINVFRTIVSNIWFGNSYPHADWLARTSTRLGEKIEPRVIASLVYKTQHMYAKIGNYLEDDTGFSALVDDF